MGVSPLLAEAKDLSPRDLLKVTNTVQGIKPGLRISGGELEVSCAGWVLVYLFSRLIGLGRRNGHVFFFFSATAKLDPPWMFRSTVACILDVTFRRLKRWDLLWNAWVLLSLGSFIAILFLDAALSSLQTNWTALDCGILQYRFWKLVSSLRWGPKWAVLGLWPLRSLACYSIISQPGYSRLQGYHAGLW